MTDNVQSNDDCVLTDAELDSVSGGDFLGDMVPTNGDNPVVQTVINTANYVYRKSLVSGVGTCHC